MIIKKFEMTIYFVYISFIFLHLGMFSMHVDWLLWEVLIFQSAAFQVSWPPFQLAFSCKGGAIPVQMWGQGFSPIGHGVLPSVKPRYVLPLDTLKNNPLELPIFTMCLWLLSVNELRIWKNFLLIAPWYSKIPTQK